jgi:hypothetical protein
MLEVRNRGWQRNRNRSYLPDQVGTSAKFRHSFFSRSLKRIVVAYELAIMYQNPPAHLVGFKILPHAFVSSQFAIQVSHNHVLAIIFSQDLGCDKITSGGALWWWVDARFLGGTSTVARHLRL